MNETGAENAPLTPEQATASLRWFGDQIPGGFFVYRNDADGGLVYANRAVMQMYGCATEAEFRALTGYTFRGMVCPEDYAATQQAIEQQIRDSGALDTVEYRIVRKDGAVRWVDDYGHLSELEGFGSVFYVFASDITEKRKAVAERFRVEMELEQARNANEIKSAFLFNLSHDIRTPMNAVLGFSALAKRHIGDPARLADYLDKVENAGRQLMALIDDMLEMSRLDYGRIELENDPADLRALLDGVTDLFRVQAAEKHLNLIEELDLPEEPVLVDTGRFTRVMENLIGNAVKFTPEGGRITVSARRKQVSDSGYARYCFIVADTGVGMSEAFMRRMYEAFEREQTSTQTGTIGTGLGLSIVKKLLDVMGGSIAVRSKKGEGSVFTVELPLKLAGEPQKAAEPMPEPPRADDGTRRVLLVEDIEINRMLAETILEEAGFTVESVCDGCDAVDAIRNHPPYYYDLILMDIQMPVMNGYEATRVIRAIDREDIRSLPIIALSANAREEDRRRSIESGMNNHVAKPFDVAHLISTINDHIRASKEKT